ncbi:hypothetical protein EDC48_11311 [Gibbsiella quercinecans]|uniref:Oxidoreductase n=2 Tax=Gibbsiella quercinecans TaxID=929813 RepID=A0A250B1F4_9GAMM|nr:molybdopterin-dependent oxidoreductase [Gibbsiella quercinecans]ATA20070.1 oxidoreductase [Gibbsiella quercinecans]RLM08087.1 oxidoreductase [Gibbsiella quercinecans]RLM09077.1 oxidoreductase [Gibbsiella quercinecans]TCT86449.1 hypothetical protein EDC48_11311 [Gibbsiella quercinecans]
MIMPLLKRVMFALLALVIIQSSAYSFTLEVSGKIKNTNDDTHTRYIFTDKQLYAMPVSSIITSTSWTPKKNFEGVLLSQLLETVGAEGSTMTFYALNDYTIDVPVSDVAKYQMILAYRMDGIPLQVKNFGPLFLIYPRDSGDTELNSPLYNSRFIWQINRVVIK